MSGQLTAVAPTEAANQFSWLGGATSLIPSDKLYKLAETLRDGYQKAEPFPHVVIDGLFDDSMLDQLIAVFPGPKDPFWYRFDAEQEVKLALNEEDAIPLPIRLFLYFLNGSLFTKFLERLTGIPGIVPDPHWVGGGLHQIERHGKLAIHADFNRHERFNLDRRLNLLIYLNKDWRAEYGGDFELWDRSMTHCVEKVAPLFNRMVVFSTTDFSFHGHPDELLCPRDRTRKSLALYYYSNGRPDDERSGEHSTLFKPRPQETFKGGIKRRLKPYVPPVIFDLYDRLTG
jgi:hypothetical protein